MSEAFAFTDAKFNRRFWSKVDIGPECWLWTASVTGVGYGQINLGRGRIGLSHRLMYELYNGPIPVGMFVCHRCDVRRCCRPDHLFLGTPADNSRDMTGKGRSTKGRPQPTSSHMCGERHGRSRLSAEQIMEIRDRYSAGGVSREQLGDEYGVSKTHVGGIIRGRFWAHLPVLSKRA